MGMRMRMEMKMSNIIMKIAEKRKEFRNVADFQA